MTVYSRDNKTFSIQIDYFIYNLYSSETDIIRNYLGQ